MTQQAPCLRTSERGINGKLTETKTLIENAGEIKAAAQMTWTMYACSIYAVLAFLVLLIFSVAGGIGPRWAACNFDEVWHTGAALLLIFSSLVTEICLLLATSANHQIVSEINTSDKAVKLPGMGDQFITLASYVTKFACGAYIWVFSGGVMHTDSLAVGGPRPVYAARFVQWSVAVPLLVLITNKAFIDSFGHLMWRSGPSLVVAFIYVWMAWIMEVTSVHLLRWPMMVFSMSGAILVSIDQIQLAKECVGVQMFGTKVGMLVYQILSFVLYASVFLMGRFGVITSSSEQILYAYMDATVKVLQGAVLAMIRNREGALEIRDWWTAASAANSDLRDVLRQARVPTLSIDLSGSITDWNDSITKLTGLQEAAVRGKPLVELSPAESREALQAELCRQLDIFGSAGKTDSLPDDEKYPMLELSVATEEGAKGLPSLRKLAMTFVPKRDKKGNLEGATAIGQDLSELAEMKLVQERRNTLTAMISHEFRTPLHGMMGLVGAIMENPSTKPMARQLGMVKGCAGRLLDMVTDVMTLAESEKRNVNGVHAKAHSSVDFGSILDEAITMISNSVDKANKPLLKTGVCLTNEALGHKLPLIRGHHSKCTQVVYNLLTNACKFTDKGSITISFRHLEKEQLLALDVADTGKGIAEEAQARIFRPFERENMDDIRSFQGIGLGLSVGKQIAESHGGSLTVKSSVGTGSTFTFSLPCPGDLGYGEIMNEKGAAGARVEKPVPEPADALGTKKSSEVPKPTAPVSAKKPEHRPLILSVDDDEVNQEVIKQAFEGLWEVVIAMDGYEALRYLKQVQNEGRRCPDLVLLDIQMPGMTGFEVCEAIRNTFALEPGKLPVTMVSAKTPADEVAIQAFNSGSTDFVSKPFNKEVLKRKVLAALRMKDTAGGPPCASTYMLAREAQAMIQKHEQTAKNALQELNSLKGDQKRQSSSQSENQELETLKSKILSERMEFTKQLNEQRKLLQSHEETAKQVEALKEEQKQLQSKSQELEALKEERKQLQSKSQELEHLRSTKDSERHDLVKQVNVQKEQIESLQKQLQAALKRKVSDSDARDARPEIKSRDGAGSAHYGLAPMKATANVLRAVKLLGARLQMSVTIARSCRDILNRLLSQFTPEIQDFCQESAQSHLEEFKACSKVVSSELALLEEVASNTDAITNLTAHVQEGQ